MFRVVRRPLLSGVSAARIIASVLEVGYATSIGRVHTDWIADDDYGGIVLPYLS